MEKVSNIKKYLFISVKPEFANKIIAKEKCIELRKIKPHVKAGDYIIIYASSPIKCVVGFGKIKQITETTPMEMWSNYSEYLGIDELRFSNYYAGRKRAIGIEIETIKSVTPINLISLKKVDANFHPPQVYRYVTNEQVCETITKFLTLK